MREDTVTEIRAHAAAVFPMESCGLVVVRKGKERYWPCRNLATGSEQFHLHHEDYAAAEEQGDIVRIVHSHPNIAPVPSQADLVGCDASGLPWVIVNWPTGAIHEFQPSGYVAPLVGRVFSHGVLDCYTLIRDYYQRELQITIPDFERRDDWWKTEQNLYRDNFAAAGFVRIEESALRTHDVILMQLSSDKTNHGAVYLGDGKILHHPMNRLSGREMFGGFWQNIATVYLHHKDVP